MAGLEIAAGIAQGLEKATQNIYAISEARKNRERQNKIDEYSFKQAELELKKLEEETSPEMHKARLDALKAKSRGAKADFAKDIISMRIAQSKEEREAELSAARLSMINEARARIESGEQGTVTKEGKFIPYKPNSATQSYLNEQQRMGSTGDEILEDISARKKDLTMYGVDTNYIKSQYTKAYGKNVRGSAMPEEQGQEPVKWMSAQEGFNLGVNKRLAGGNEEEYIPVINKKGETGTVLKSKLGEALKRGYKRQTAK